MSVVGERGWLEASDAWLRDFMPWRYGQRAAIQQLMLAPPVDRVLEELAGPNGHDFEWLAVITMPYEPIEFAGKLVPVWEGDVERICWQDARRFERDLERWS